MLRNYQQHDTHRLRRAYAEGAQAVLYALPTGGGKTHVIAHACKLAVERGRRVLILVHRTELWQQCSAKLDDVGLPHGIIAPKQTRTSDPVQVASVQTLVRRLRKTPPPADLIVIDEAHHAVAGSWSKILDAYQGAKILGVTATPCRLDGRGLGDVFDSLVAGPSVAELTQRGYLSPSVTFEPPSDLDLTGVHKRGGDYVPHELQAAVAKSAIVGDAVEHYAKHAAGMPAIAFCASVDDAYETARQFRAAGYRATALEGRTSAVERRESIDALGAGGLDVLTSCQIVSEGTDVPRVGCAILLRPTASLSLYLQQVGRALRPYPGKERTVILDHVGNNQRHGLPHDPRQWSLDGKPKSDGAMPSKRCPACFVVVSASARVCPEPDCGHVFEVASSSREIAIIEGELVEARRADMSTLEGIIDVARQRQYKKGWIVRRWAEQQGAEITLSLVQEVGRALGYRPGWASNWWHAAGRYMKRAERVELGR